MHGDHNYHSCHLQILLGHKTKFVIKATQGQSQLFVFPAQAFVFIQKRKKLTLCFSQTLQLKKKKIGWKKMQKLKRCIKFQAAVPSCGSNMFGYG